jgi:hypothetical protein
MNFRALESLLKSAEDGHENARVTKYTAISIKIVAQAWAWRDSKNQMIFDSIESHIDFRRKYPVMLTDFYILLSDILVKKQNIPADGYSNACHEILSCCYVELTDLFK